MSDTTPAPVVQPGDDGSSSVIREMRASLERANREGKEAADRFTALQTLANEAAAQRDQLQTKLTEREQAEMAEIDRLKAQLADREAKIGELAPIRDEHGRYVNAFETLYKRELDAIPEDKRELIAGLSDKGAWPDRLESLAKAKQLLPAPPAGPPTSAGTITNPPGGAPREPAPSTPTRLDPKNPPKWGDVLKPVSKGPAQV